MTSMTPGPGLSGLETPAQESSGPGPIPLVVAVGPPVGYDGPGLLATGAGVTATEWVVVNGHVLGRCAYLTSLDEPWEPEAECDCRDLLEDDPIWGRGDDDDDDWCW